jgi:mannose-6-phosphate isomerase-like protein (cupin superfamily)
MRLLTVTLTVVLALAAPALRTASVPAAAEAKAGDPVTFIPAARVTEAFAKGAPLDETARYKVHASRREAPGMAEVHVYDTDIIYVLDGAATIVTGGAVVDAKTTAPGEIRGPSIARGNSQRLTKGDLFVVPNGVPHWFASVDAPFLYYVVKATDTAGAR